MPLCVCPVIATAGRGWWRCVVPRISPAARLGARAAGEVLGITHLDQPCTAVAIERQTQRGTRSAKAGLRLVHRRLRHERFDRSQGADRGVGVMIADRCVSSCRVRIAHAALPSLAKAALTSRHCFNSAATWQRTTACAVRTLRQFTHQVDGVVVPAKAGTHTARVR